MPTTDRPSATKIIYSPAPPRLPFDVQLIVAENCPDVATIMALVSSHRTLRERGARLALQIPTARVKLHTETCFRSFFHFVAPFGRIENPAPRLTHLHTLDVSLGTVGAASIEALTTMLAHVPELSSLTIREPEETLAGDPALYAALQGLTTLKALHAFAAGPATQKLFVEVASPLEDVTLTHNPSPYAVFADGLLDIGKFLRPHQDTLTRVCASRATPFARGDTKTAVFENVCDLVIHGFAWDTAPNFLDVFPNIVSLDVGTAVTARWPWSPMLTRVRNANKFIAGGTDDGESDDTSSDSDDDSDDDDSEWDSSDSGEETEVRYNLNIDIGQPARWQEFGTHRQAGEDDGGDVRDEDDNGVHPLAWESLERVRGGLLDLYVFGNSCVVDVLTIDGPVQDAWACIPAVVGDHRPSTLRLSVSSSLKTDTWNWKKLVSVRELILEIVVEDLFDEQGLLVSAIPL